MATKTAQNQNLMGAVAYLLGFITGIVLLIVEKENKFVRFHAMQSTIVFGGLFVVNFILGFVPVFGAILSPLLGIVGFILWLVLMYKAYQGELYKLPYVGKIADEQLAKIK
jgi:uncharacterized membrane protein